MNKKNKNKQQIYNKINKYYNMKNKKKYNLKTQNNNKKI